MKLNSFFYEQDKMSTAFSEAWANYQAAWRDISDSERRKLLEISVTPRIHYRDPENNVRGIDALMAVITTFISQAPGATFLNRQFLEHHGKAIANWELRDAEGDLVTVGASLAIRTNDNFITEITGYF